MNECPVCGAALINNINKELTCANLAHRAVFDEDGWVSAGPPLTVFQAKQAGDFRGRKK